MSYSWRDDEEKYEEEEEEKIEPRPMSSDVALRLHEGKRKKAAERESRRKRMLEHMKSMTNASLHVRSL